MKAVKTPGLKVESPKKWEYDKDIKECKSFLSLLNYQQATLEMAIQNDKLKINSDVLDIAIEGRLDYYKHERNRYDVIREINAKLQFLSDLQEKARVQEGFIAHEIEMAKAGIKELVKKAREIIKQGQCPKKSLTRITEMLGAYEKGGRYASRNDLLGKFFTALQTEVEIAENVMKVLRGNPFL